ncbi:MAG: DNA repair protein RadC [Bacteroidales bacterium]|nr:DNA repair protein RadC [Bacteroidales bacterium]
MAIRTIKEWQDKDRPREKMIANGAEVLTETELLAILIKTGVKDRATALDVARDVMQAGGNRLRGVADLSLANLMKIDGVGSAKAVEILAAMELGRRMMAEEPEYLPDIYSSNTVAGIISPFLQHLKHEECWVLYLNKHNAMIGKEKVSIGGLDSTTMDVRIIVKKALEKSACGIILVHNHPSGIPTPGEQDKKCTKMLKSALNMMDIMLLDHIIIGRNSYYSFSDEGLF